MSRQTPPAADSSAVIVARPWGPSWWHAAGIVVGLVYLCAIFLNSSGSRLPRDLLPGPALYFAQVACLFPHAAMFSIEYRVEAYSCEQRQFVPFDHRPDFPVHPNDKENRLHRVAHFYRRNAKVMTALEEYLVERHNSRTVQQRAASTVGGPIGGIAVLSLRVPFPEPGSQVERYRYDPLGPAPLSWRKPWYRTPKTRRETLCREAQ